MTLNRCSIIVIVSVVLTSSVVGCSSPKGKEWKPEPERRAYRVSLRQVPPEPVYNRLRWVLPPDVLPSRELPQQAGPIIYPVLHLDLKNSTLEEASRALASSANYDSFCSSGLANRRISFSHLGNIDELARQLEEAADIRVQVDHENRAVRFLPKPAPVPEFYGSTETTNAVDPLVGQKEVMSNEHKSPN